MPSPSQRPIVATDLAARRGTCGLIGLMQCDGSRDQVRLSGWIRRSNDRRCHVRIIESLWSQSRSSLHPGRFGHAAPDRDETMASRSKNLDTGWAGARVRSGARHRPSGHRYSARRGAFTLAARPRDFRCRNLCLPALVQACDKLGCARRHDQGQRTKTH